MTDAEQRIVELAAETECKNQWSDDGCAAGDCLHCLAAKILPELRCACGKYALDRAHPSMWDTGISHDANKCTAPKPQTHCSSCKQPLPVSR